MGVKHWVDVPGDLARSMPPVDQNVSGVQVTVYVSPFDAPTAVRGRYDAQLGRYLIEFKYGGEDRIEREQRGNLTLRVGRRTKRLYGIELDPAQPGPREITVQIVNDASAQLQGLSDAAVDARQRLHFGAASRALDATRAQISGVVEGRAELSGNLNVKRGE